MAIGNSKHPLCGIDVILENTRATYVKAKQDLHYLEEGGVLTHMEGYAALERLEEAWKHFTDLAEHYIPFNHAVVAPLPPAINRLRRKGIIAFREWKSTMIDDGKLHPLVMGMHCEWKPIMYADEVPNEHNHNGLYARTVGPDLIQSYQGWTGYGANEIWGFVELIGHVEEHADGVYRAEKAEVLSLYVPVNDDYSQARLVMGALKYLTDSFFPVPVYPVTPYQSKLILMREILISCGVATY